MDIPIEYINFTDRVITYAKDTLKRDLNDNVYITLTDHIYTAIRRNEEGIPIKNMILYDIRRLYPDEFNVSLEIIKMIKEDFKVSLDPDEGGFIALHLINASEGNTLSENMYEATKIMKNILNIIKYVFHIDFDEDNVYFQRFITHLKFFVYRMLSKSTYKSQNIDDLLFMVKRKYKNSYDCTDKIGNFLKKQYNHELSHEERLYLTIHIEKIIYKTNA